MRRFSHLSGLPENSSIAESESTSRLLLRKQVLESKILAFGSETVARRHVVMGC